MLTDEKIFLEGQGRDKDEEVSDPNFQRIKSWLDTYVHQSIEAHKLHSTRPPSKLSVDYGIGSNQSSITHVSEPPEVPQRRMSNIEHPADGDYENIIKGKFNIIYVPQDTAGKKHEGKDSELIQAETVDSEQGLNNRDENESNKMLSKELNKNVNSDTKQDTDDLMKENNSEIISPNKPLVFRQINSSKSEENNKPADNQIIIDGKDHEVRRYILDQSDTSDYLENSLEAQTFIENKNNSREITEKILDKNSIPNKQDVIHSPVRKALSENEGLVTNQIEEFFKLENKSNSTSYESLCYSEDPVEDNNEGNPLQHQDLVTSTELLNKSILNDERANLSTNLKPMSAQSAEELEETFPILSTNDCLDTDNTSKESSVMDEEFNKNTSEHAPMSTVNVSNTCNTAVKQIVISSNDYENSSKLKTTQIITENRETIFFNETNDEHSLTTFGKLEQETNLPTVESVNNLLITDNSLKDVILNRVNCDNRGNSITPIPSQLVVSTSNKSEHSSSYPEEYEDTGDNNGDNSDDNQDEPNQQQLPNQTKNNIISPYNKSQYISNEPQKPTDSFIISVDQFINDGGNTIEQTSTHLQEHTKNVIRDRAINSNNIDTKEDTIDMDMLNNTGGSLDRNRESIHSDETYNDNRPSKLSEDLIVDSVLNDPNFSATEESVLHSKSNTLKDSTNLDETSTTEIDSRESSRSPVNSPDYISKTPESIKSSETVDNDISVNTHHKSSTEDLDSVSPSLGDSPFKNQNSDSVTQSEEDVSDNKSIPIKNNEKSSSNSSLLDVVNENVEQVMSKSQERLSSSETTNISSMPEYIIHEVHNSNSESRSSVDHDTKSTRVSSTKSHTSDKSLSMIESRAEILELLKESLSSDLVLDRIVSTLFASVLNPVESVSLTLPSSGDGTMSSEREDKLFQTLSSTDSEIKTESDFFEAQEDVGDEDIEEQILQLNNQNEYEQEDSGLFGQELEHVEQEESLSDDQQNRLEFEVSGRTLIEILQFLNCTD